MNREQRRKRRTEGVGTGTVLPLDRSVSLLLPVFPSQPAVEHLERAALGGFPNPPALWLRRAKLGFAYAIAAAVGAVEYVAVFLALSLVTNRALVIGLAYVVVWEGVVAGLFAGTRIVSIRQHALAVADAIGGDGAVTAELAVTTAVVVAGLVTVLAFALAVRRLQRVELRGETG